MVIHTLSAPASTSAMDRFRSDLRRRFPERSTAPRIPAAPSKAREGRKGLGHKLEKLPPEIGVLLIVIGTAGVLLPGPVGSPFLVAGSIALWPAAFRRTEDWLQCMAPRMYDEGIRQLERFLADLERRYPGCTR